MLKNRPAPKGIRSSGWKGNEEGKGDGGEMMARKEGKKENEDTVRVESEESVDRVREEGRGF